MALRIISVSKVLFDDKWDELSSAKLGSREQHSLNFMLVMKSKSENSTIRIKIVGIELPQKLVFNNDSLVRIGSGMIVYDSSTLNEEQTQPLPLNSLDRQF